MTEYRFATAQDWPKIIDFIDLVFSQAARPHDFADLIPKVYADGHDYSHIHAIALEDGEIRGCVAVLPFDMTIAGQTLHVGYLGSVSVHRLSRSKGHMKKLMQMQIDKAKADGLDMIVLSGQRQRYGYFGFYPAGGSFGYSVSRANVRHALGDVDASSLTFEMLVQGENTDFAYELYQQQPVCGARPKERFAEFALSFNAQGWLIKKAGENAGYLIASKDHSGISELVLHDPSLVPAIIKAWMEIHGVRHLHVSAAPYNKALNRTLSSFAEDYSIGLDGYTLFLNHANALRCWMNLKNSIAPLPDGKICLNIEGENLEITVADGAVNVKKTDASAAVSLTVYEAAELFYSFNRFYAAEVPGIPAEWFPLPLYINRADTF